MRRSHSFLFREISRSRWGLKIENLFCFFADCQALKEFEIARLSLWTKAFGYLDCFSSSSWVSRRIFFSLGESFSDLHFSISFDVLEEVNNLCERLERVAV